MAFSVPLEGWLRRPRKDKIRAAPLSPREVDAGLSNVAFLKRTCDENTKCVRDYSRALWSLLMFSALLNNKFARRDS
jgi:hypothetical protein